MRIRRRRHRWAAIDVGGATDVGRRDDNQDRWAAGANWAVVCDGVGGHAGGATAAELALAATVAHLSDAGRDPVDALRAAAANTAVLAGREAAPDRADMATTLTAAVRVGPRRWTILQVGDSPAWLVGPATARSVTWDHNLVGDMVRAGALTPDEAVGHRGRHVITRAIGIAPTVEPELFTVDLPAGTALVLASDGLSDVAGPADAAPVATAASDAGAAARGLVALALDRGTRDNVTVVVAR